MFYGAKILQGENWCWSLLGLKMLQAKTFFEAIDFNTFKVQFCFETVSGRLLQRRTKMNIDWKLKKLS